MPSLEPYEAVLLVSFGGPEAPEEVLPFLQTVTAGRGIPDERLVEVGEHYSRFGGRSPINDQCRALLAALRRELDARGLDRPLYWGNRNSEPWLADAFADLARDGYRRVLAVFTSAYPCYSSCRQYRENLYDARGDSDVQVDRIRHYANTPGFVAASVDAVLDALGRSAVDPVLVFVTHAIPTAMAETSGPGPGSSDGAYVAWHRSVAAAVVAGVADHLGRELAWDLVFCSRSGLPGQPWTEPDVNDHLRKLHADGVRSVVVVPSGFVSDHMEVIFDLDTEAAGTAGELGLDFIRAATVGTSPAFVTQLVDLMLERAAVARHEPVSRPVCVGAEPGHDVCPSDCCVNLRQPGRPTLCGADTSAP